MIRVDKCLHCIECDVCINYRSHHSSILGKCVGNKNQLSYNISIVSFMITCGIILGSILLAFIH